VVGGKEESKGDKRAFLDIPGITPWGRSQGSTRAWLCPS
jgi:hypothetical protein